MWDSLDAAMTALDRDGWKRHTAYWWFKPVSGRTVWVEIDRVPWHGTTLFHPVLQPDDE